MSIRCMKENGKNARTTNATAKFAMAAVLSLGCMVPAMAATRNVSTAAEFDTALSASVFGDVIKFNSGSFTLSGPKNIPPGISIEGNGAANTTVKSSSTSGAIFRFVTGGGTPVNGNQYLKSITLDGNNRANSEGARFENRSNITVDSVTFQNFAGDTLTLTGAGWSYPHAPENRATGIEVKNCTFINSGTSTDADATYKSGVVIIGNTTDAKFHHNTIISPNIATHGIKYSTAAGRFDVPGGTVVNQGGWNYGLQVYDNNITVGGNSRSFAIELFNAFVSSTGPVRIYNNNLNAAVSLGGQAGDNILNGDGTIDVRVDHNTINMSVSGGHVVECQGGDIEIDNNYFVNPGIYGIAIWNGGDTGNRKNYYIHDNVFEDIRVAQESRGVNVQQIPATNGSLNLNIYNNTFYNLDIGVVVKTYESTEQIKGVYVKNNVFQKMARATVSGTRSKNEGTWDDINISHNIAYEGVTAAFTYINNSPWTITNLTTTPHTVINPDLNLSGNKTYPFFAPASSSSAVVNAGTTLIPSRTTNRTYVGNPDIGAIEWGQNSTNLISNPSFDAEAYDTKTPSGWSKAQWGPSWNVVTPADASYTESYGGSKSGARHGTHYYSSAYRIYTYQTKTGLTNGLYTLRAWVKSSGGQSTAQLEAKDHGDNGSKQTKSTTTTGKSLKSAIGTYEQVEIKDINVTNGSISIGLYSDAPGGKWLYFDDVELIKQ